MLKKLTAAGLVAAAASGAILLASPASAGMNTNGDGSILSGNNVIIPVSIPVNICGDSIAIIGRSAAACRGRASVGAGQHEHGYHHPWDS